MNNNNNNICSIDQIYCDNPQEISIENNNNNFFNKKLPSNILSKKIFNYNNTSNLSSNNNNDNNNSFNNEEEIICCNYCNEIFTKGEIVYYCDCDSYYHPNCLLKMNGTNNNNSIINNNSINYNCNVCNTKYNIGIYKLKTPINVLNNTNFNNNNNNSYSTLEKTVISMDTNINNLDNYEKMCNLAYNVNADSMIELIKDNNFNNNNINNSDNFNNDNSNNKSINRIALSPINFSSNTPYNGNKSKFINSYSSGFFDNNYNNTNKNNNNINNSSNNSPDFSLNNIKQHLTFLSNNKKDSLNKYNNEIILNNNYNNELSRNLTNIFNMSNNSILNNNNNMNSNININYNNNINLNNSINNNNYSFKHLNFDDINNDFNNENNNTDDDDKENTPPIPKEYYSNSINNNNQNNNNNYNKLDITIEGGISHINSNTCITIDIPITITISTPSSTILQQQNEPLYSKDTLLIFNSQNLNIDTILKILQLISNKISNFDRIYSNIFKQGNWLTKKDLNEIIFNCMNSDTENNNLNYNINKYFQSTQKINYLSLENFLEYGINMSVNTPSQIFSILLINDIDSIPLSINYNELLEKLSKILQKSKINLIKYFSINCILLDDINVIKTNENLKFISFIYDLSLLCLGYFFSPINAEELIKSVNIFFEIINQFNLLNFKILMKGNKDPSLFIKTFNYPCVEKSHNDYEIGIGSLMKKEKKILSVNAKVIINNPLISLSLPVFEICCEYLSLNDCNINNNIINSNFMNNVNNSDENIIINNNNFLKEKKLILNRTNYFSFNIPILNNNNDNFCKFKIVNYNQTVLLRNFIAVTAEKINYGLMNIKENNFNDALNNFKEAKNNFENSIKTKTNLFNYFQYLNNSFYDNDYNLVKIFKFIMMINNDLNYIINILENKNITNICKIFTINESLNYYRSVVLNDERFIEDNF